MNTTHKFINPMGVVTFLQPWKERKIARVVSVVYLPGTNDPEDPTDVGELEFTYELVDQPID